MSSFRFEVQSELVHGADRIYQGCAVASTHIRLDMSCLHRIIDVALVEAGLQGCPTGRGLRRRQGMVMTNCKVQRPRKDVLAPAPIFNRDGPRRKIPVRVCGDDAGES
jgi:hypothetical protein